MREVRDGHSTESLKKLRSMNEVRVVFYLPWIYTSYNGGIKVYIDVISIILWPKRFVGFRVCDVCV